MEYTEHQQSLLRKLEQLQKDEGLSLSALSARLGISKGALSQLFSGSYQANPQKMFAKLESYFGVKDQTRQTYQESGYADTSISTEIYDLSVSARSRAVLPLLPEMPASERPRQHSTLWQSTRTTAY
mgnify:CR=1 FL=1